MRASFWSTCLRRPWQPRWPSWRHPSQPRWPVAAASFAASLVVVGGVLRSLAGCRGGVLRSLACCRGGVLRSLACCRGGVLRSLAGCRRGFLRSLARCRCGVLRSLARYRGGVLRGVGGCREGLRRLRVHVIGGERIPFVDARTRAPPHDGDGGDHTTEDQQPEQELPHRHLLACDPPSLTSSEVRRPLGPDAHRQRSADQGPFGEPREHEERSFGELREGRSSSVPHRYSPTHLTENGGVIWLSR